MLRTQSKYQSSRSLIAIYIPLQIDFLLKMAFLIVGLWAKFFNISSAKLINSICQGTTDKSAFCETCGQSSVNCVGHYAYIKLVVPVFHIGYFKHTIAILQAICKVCIPRKTLVLCVNHFSRHALVCC